LNIIFYAMKPTLAMIKYFEYLHIIYAISVSIYTLQSIGPAEITSKILRYAIIYFQNKY